MRNPSAPRFRASSNLPPPRRPPEVNITNRSFTSISENAFNSSSVPPGDPAKTTGASISPGATPRGKKVKSVPSTQGISCFAPSRSTIRVSEVPSVIGVTSSKGNAWKYVLPPGPSSACASAPAM